MENQLVRNLHGTAKSKGWWEKPRETAELKTLIVSELIEAFEEVRKGTPKFYFVENGIIVERPDATVRSFTVVMPQNFCVTPQDEAKTIQEIRTMIAKPEGEAVELADAWIRCADWMGFLNGNYEEMRSKIKCEISPETSIPQMYHDVIGAVFATPYAPMEWRLAGIMMTIEKICERRGFNLAEVLILKDEYNKTRAYRHGGKKY